MIAKIEAARTIDSEEGARELDEEVKRFTTCLITTKQKDFTRDNEHHHHHSQNGESPKNSREESNVTFFRMPTRFSSLNGEKLTIELDEIDEIDDEAKKEVSYG